MRRLNDDSVINLISKQGHTSMYYVGYVVPFLVIHGMAHIYSLCLNKLIELINSPNKIITTEERVRLFNTLLMSW